MKGRKKGKKLSKKQKNLVKNEVLPNIFSISGFVGSTASLLATIFIHNQLFFALTSFAILIAVALLIFILQKRANAKIESNNGVTKFRKKLAIGAEFAAYFGCLIFVLSVNIALRH